MSAGRIENSSARRQCAPGSSSSSASIQATYSPRASAAGVARRGRPGGQPPAALPRIVHRGAAIRRRVHRAVVDHDDLDAADVLR
jgi:hypothetical protein